MLSRSMMQRKKPLKATASAAASSIWDDDDEPSIGRQVFREEDIPTRDELLELCGEDCSIRSVN